MELLALISGTGGVTCCYNGFFGLLDTDVASDNLLGAFAEALGLVERTVNPDCAVFWCHMHLRAQGLRFLLLFLFHFYRNQTVLGLQDCRRSDHLYTTTVRHSRY